MKEECDLQSTKSFIGSINVLLFCDHGLKRARHPCTKKYNRIQSCQHAHTLSHTHTLTHTQEVKAQNNHTLCTVKCLTKAGDVGATTGGCYNAVARPTRDVVISLCPWEMKRELRY